MGVIGRAAVLIILLPAPGSVAGQPDGGQGRAWMFGPFDKPREVNPAIAPSPVMPLPRLMRITTVSA